MPLEKKRVMVTGGAGFIGSHIVDRLCSENEVIVCDTFSGPATDRRNEDATYLKEDILNLNRLVETMTDIDIVFHFAAAPSVKESSEDPLFSFEENVRGTVNVLEASRKNDVEEIVFASTSTVYGEAEEFPTPETAPLEPISNYGASKTSGEMYLRSYSSTYGIKAVALRYANIFGPRSDHGVMYDFFHKLKENPETLEILGNGEQRKSYLYIDDCIDATLKSLECDKKFEAFNIGSEEQVSVNEIADVISDEMGLNPEYEYTGGEKGWKGDVAKMLLKIDKIKSLGWKPKTSTEEGIRKYIRWLEKNYD